ncbi:MAG: winged helix-turn-helix transcriptional regulator [Rubrivivax sp.]|nr:winged helix-turn-helix transcriptional regulator [Rubrivivax sp.]
MNNRPSREEETLPRKENGRAAAKPVPARTPRGDGAGAAPDLDNDAPVRVLRQFRIVFNAVKTHFQQVERRAGIGGAQVWALSVIRDRPGLGVNGLAEALNIRQPTASNLIKGLIRQGLVEARREGPDRRAVQLHALAEGRRILRRAPGPFSGVLPAALASLTPEVLERLEADLAALIEALGADSQAATVPLAQL